ncbi:hypothetical protein [Sutcliffiella cohnii]|uniref:hypothetical protein n=1 Tax=Sutcliffiella cohnii TaxID=33932 RepID=UPI002E22BC73|nr:hypothetical protein [Sutcliffiella cohnii]
MSELVTQRNKFDVAMELTKFHFTKVDSLESEDQLQEAFAKYYTLVEYLENTSPVQLQKLLSEDLVFKIGELEEPNSAF